MSVPGKMHSRVESHKFRVSIKTLDVARVHTFYRHDRSWITGRGARGGDRRPVPNAVPSQCRDPIDRSTHRAVARLKRRKTAGGSGYRGSATGEAQWPIGPRTMGPPRRTTLDNRSMSQMGWPCKMVVSSRVSGAVAHVSKHRLGRRSLTGPQVRETTGPPSDDRPTSQ